ncbi:MAG: TaqI-like C-terminal specificity domain-containing protein, partial [Myxococcota bacterium]
DRDPTAVAVTQLALSLACADRSGGSGSVPPLATPDGPDSPNGLNSPDSPAAAPATLAEMSDTRSPGTVVCADSLLDPLGAGLGDGSFDAVIGNPPWGQKGFRFAPDQAAALRARYVTATGALDPFKLFVERAHQLIAAGGRWGLLLPDIILLKNHQPVRDLILRESHLRWIADVGRAFAGVNLDAVAMIGQRRSEASSQPSSQPEPATDRENSPAAPGSVAIWHSVPPTWRDHPPATRHLDQAVFAELDGHKFNIHLTPGDLRLLRQLAELPRLGQIFEAHEGVHSGNVRAKLFRDHRASEHCVPLILGRGEIARYALRWDGRWLDRSPGLVDRAAGEDANQGRPAWHCRPKIVVRRTGDRLIAAYDQRGYYVANNLFVVLPRPSAPAMDTAELRAYVALLNSRCITWYFRTVQPRTGRLFAELKIEHLLAFPRPAEPVWRPLVPRLAELCAAIEQALDRPDSPQREPAPPCAAAEQDEIDRLILAALGLPGDLAGEPSR